MAWGLGTLVLAIVALDQLVWRPLLAWSERFKVEMVESDNPPTSWFYDLLHDARIAALVAAAADRAGWRRRFDRAHDPPGGRLGRCR